jgi:hypothetical protein
MDSKLMLSSSLRQKLFTSLVLSFAIGTLCFLFQDRANAQLTILHSFGDGAVATTEPIRRQVWSKHQTVIVME